MSDLTITYVRGKFITGAERMQVEIDGRDEGALKDMETRAFDLPDGWHLLVFRSAYCTKRVDLLLSGGDSFTVTWDRTLGGIRLIDEYDGDNLLDGHGWKYLAVIAAIVVIGSIIVGLRNAGEITAEYALAGILAMFAAIILLLAHIHWKRSKNVVRGGEKE